MGRSFCTSALALLLGVTALGSTAQAQHRRHGHHHHHHHGAQGPTAAQQEQARQAYSHGQQLFQSGQFQEAEAAFQQAYSIIPNPVVLLGVAQAQESEGNITGAIATLQRYLTERPDAPDKDQQQQKIAELQAHPATVTVHSTPAGASIWLDDQDTGKTTPADVDVPPGDHTLSIRLEGHETATQAVTAEPGGTHQVEVTLEASAPPPQPAETQRPPADEGFGAGEGQQPPAETPVDTGADHKPSTGVWVAGGIAGAGLVAGTVLGFLALSEQADFDASPNKATADRGETLALFADVGFGVALAGTITAIVLYVTGDRGDDAAGGDTQASVSGTRVQVAPVFGPTTGGVQARVRF